MKPATAALVAAMIATGIAAPASAGGVTGAIMEPQVIVASTAAPSHDWVVLVLLAAVIAAAVAK